MNATGDETMKDTIKKEFEKWMDGDCSEKAFKFADSFGFGFHEDEFQAIAFYDGFMARERLLLETVKEPPKKP